MKEDLLHPVMGDECFHLVHDPARRIDANALPPIAARRAEVTANRAPPGGDDKPHTALPHEVTSIGIVRQWQIVEVVDHFTGFGGDDLFSVAKGNSLDVPKRGAFVQGMTQLPEGQFPFTDHHTVRSIIAKCLLGQKRDMDPAKDNLYLRVMLAQPCTYFSDIAAVEG